jgi:rod shape-determining protein MreD
MSKVGFAVLAALLFVLEAKLSVMGLRPNLTVLLVYFVGLRYGPTRGTLFGALMGVIADSLSGNILGPNMLGKGTVGFFSSFMARGPFNWTPLFGLIGVIVLTLGDGIVAFSSLAVFSHMPTTLSNAAFTISGQAALNAVAGLYIRPADER